MHSSYYVEKVDIPVDHSHTNSIIEFIETGARHNILLVLFSIYLVLAGLFSLIFVFDETGSLKDATSILYGIASILAGVSFILIKELPRNFGFITLAIFCCWMESMLSESPSIIPITHCITLRLLGL